ncbi:MAG: ATP-binding protein [Lachnospiraceae bacterium]|nr:ATP-binding protein [Lachnospiraceae bacterium]
MGNPYTLTFGKEPINMISRNSQLNEITSTFDDTLPSQQVYMVTGVRGAGKTVFMTEVSDIMRKKHEWIVLELSPEKDMLNSLVAKLSSESEFATIFKNAKINLSFWGFGLEVTGAAPISDLEVAATKMIESLAKHGKKVLITVDEVATTQHMREFASTFQILLRRNLPVFLIMTGLYDNINRLQNEKTLTFLYRAPKIELKPLNISSIAENYKQIKGIDEASALQAAKSTRGYSFAFQVIGHFLWDNGGEFEKALAESRQYLEDYSYEKIWSELSNIDRQVLHAVASVKGGRIAAIREMLNLDTNHFNPYRNRLIKKGLLDGSTRGYLRFTLPFFEDYTMVMWE